MNRFLYLFLFLIAANFSISAQSENTSIRELPPGLRSQALLLSIESRVVGEGQEVIWSESNRRVTIPGTPTGVQLMGSNVLVVAQFTPFIGPDGNVLVAQGQIWIADPNGVVNYYTSIQTIPMELGEQIYFFPLGLYGNLIPSIEIVITVNSNEGINQRRDSINTRNER